ncbi:MAG: tetratricopeptide repeat protein [Alphaproteobacteria bacterium]|nr:tetratricopeptide repeat protein [Alphaproteobacteria bacterium]
MAKKKAVATKKTAAEKVGQFSTNTLLWIMDKFVKAFVGLTLNNFVIRGLERGTEKLALKKEEKIDPKTRLPHGETKGTRFVKNNPWVFSYLTYYLMMLSVVGGGYWGLRNRDRDNDAENTDKIENVEVTGDGQDKSGAIEAVRSWIKDVFSASEQDEEISVTPGTYGAYKARMEKILPMIITNLVSMEGVRMKDGMHVPYDDATGRILKPGQKPRGKATIGFGNTVGKDGKPITSNTPPITTEEAYELARWHLEDKETFLMMYCYDVAFDDVDVDSVHEAMMIASAIYNGGVLVIEDRNDVNAKNRFEEIRRLHDELGDALTDEYVRAYFEMFPVKKPASVGKHWLHGGKESDMADALGWFINTRKDGDGILWRRWLEACIMNCDITPQDLLNVPVNGMSEFFDYTGRARENWFIVNGQNRKVNKETVAKFKKWLANPVDKNGNSMAGSLRVRDVLPADAIAVCEKGVDKLDKKVEKVKKTKKQKIVEKETYVIGYEQEYAEALEQFQQGNYKVAREKYEALVEKYPDNALLRNDLATTYIELEMYDEAIEQVRQIVRRIGDKSQYGAAQYNAGVAYEKKGDLEKARDNYRLAVKNGNSKVQKDLDRVEKALEEKTGKKQKVAFNLASERVKAIGGTINLLEYEAMMREQEKTQKA